MHQSRALMMSVERRQEKARARETSLQLQDRWREQMDAMRQQHEQQMQQFQQEYHRKATELQQTFDASVQAEVSRRLQQDMRATPQQQMETEEATVDDDDDVETQMVEHILQNEREINDLEAEVNDLAAENTRLVKRHISLAGVQYSQRFVF